MSKRAAPSSSSNPKRIRFAPTPTYSDSPSGTPQTLDEDDFLEGDVESNPAATKQKARHALRDEGGYGSDSSGDEESVVPSRRKKEGNDDDNDDDVDMFAEDDGDDSKAEKGKEKKFMSLEEIEGQEFGQPTGEEGSDSDAEESKTGLDGDMGTEITPFNMKNEMSEGKFTTDGESYVANAEDPNDKYDVWLDGVNKEEMKKARRAHKEQEKLEREREKLEAERGEAKEKREVELLQAAVGLMERGETVLEALQRLGSHVEEERKKKEAGQKKKSWSERQKERKAQMAAEEEQRDAIHTSNPFTNLTNIVSGLDKIGHIDVYSLSRESIQRMLPQPLNNPTTHSTSVPSKPDNRQFQYRFSMAYVTNLPESQRPIEREVFGPFPLLQLKGWKSTGFFGPGCENVEIREVVDGEQSGEWGSWETVVEREES
ncbi:hypothetical protein L204_106232 [Cryptococcus depauperatus]|nr:CD2 antigen cytoplasmic tail-binding protein 2 [Cryptococcus depauperatus CBS 7855]